MNLKLIVACVYFYLPGALANVGAVIGKFVPGFKNITAPVDLGIKLRGKRLVGNHKKLGGLLFGLIVGISLGVTKYHYLDPSLPQLQILSLSSSQSFFLYSLMSCGALLGDLLRSIVKRQLNIDAHFPWIPFDEIDHSSASLLLIKIFFPISWKQIGVTIIVYFFLHVVSNLIGYQLKIKNVPY